MVNACLICVILDYYLPFPTFPAEVAPLVPYKAKRNVSTKIYMVAILHHLLLKEGLSDTT